MNKDFLQLLMERTGFPDEAKTAYMEAAGRLDSGAVDGAIRFFYEHDFDIAMLTPLIEDIAETSGVSVHTVGGLFLGFAAERARGDYLA